MPTIDELADELGALRQRVDAAEGVLAIHQLKARYGELVDRRFSTRGVADDATVAAVAAEAAALFTPDGTWDGGPGLGEVTGREAIAARLRQPTLAFSRHLFVKPRIEVDGDRARGRWDLLCPCRRPNGTSFWMCGYEDDEYRRIDGTWLHHRMRLTTLFMARIDEGWDKILA